MGWVPVAVLSAIGLAISVATFHFTWILISATALAIGLSGIYFVHGKRIQRLTSRYTVSRTASMVLWHLDSIAATMNAHATFNLHPIAYQNGVKRIMKQREEDKKDILQLLKSATKADMLYINGKYTQARDDAHSRLLWHECLTQHSKWIGMRYRRTVLFIGLTRAGAVTVPKSLARWIVQRYVQ